MRASSAAAQLKDIVSKKSCPGCLVLTSSDRTRRERALAYVLDNCNSSGSKPATFSFGEQGRVSIQSFLANCAAPSLFDPVRFAVLRSIEKAKAAELEPVSALLAKKVEGLHLIMIGEGLPNSGNFKKAIDSFATHVAFAELKGAELSRWVERELRNSDVPDAPDDVVESIISVAGDDPDAVARLIEKFSLYLDGAAPTTSTLRELEPGRALASDFELADALLSPKRANTEVLIQQLLSQGSSPFMLLGLLTKTFSTLLRIRAALDRGQGQQELREDLGISPWLLSKYLPLAKKLSADEISDRLEALLKTDFRMKDRSLGPAALLSSLASATAPARGA
jgi:DNA polymerase III delta subunit